MTNINVTLSTDITPDLPLTEEKWEGSFMVFSDFYEVAQKSPTFCRRNKTYKRLRKKTLLPATVFVLHRYMCHIGTSIL